MSTEKILQAALAADLPPGPLRDAVEEHREMERQNAEWMAEQKAKVEGKEMWCAPFHERRAIRELVSVNGTSYLGTYYTVLDNRGERWDVRELDPESAKANDGIPFIIADSDIAFAKQRAEMVMEYEARREEMGPPPTPNLRDPSDTAIVYQYWRYLVRDEEEMESLEEAISQGEADMEYNEAYPAWVTQGDKVLHSWRDDPRPSPTKEGR